MNRSDLAKYIAEKVDGDTPDGSGVWVTAHVDSDPESVWVEVSDLDDDGAAGRTFRLTIEEQP